MPFKVEGKVQLTEGGIFHWGGMINIFTTRFFFFFSKENKKQGPEEEY